MIIFRVVVWIFITTFRSRLPAELHSRNPSELPRAERLSASISRLSRQCRAIFSTSVESAARFFRGSTRRWRAQSRGLARRLPCAKGFRRAAGIDTRAACAPQTFTCHAFDDSNFFSYEFSRSSSEFHAHFEPMGFVSRRNRVSPQVFGRSPPERARFRSLPLATGRVRPTADWERWTRSASAGNKILAIQRESPR